MGTIPATLSKNRSVHITIASRPMQQSKMSKNDANTTCEPTPETKLYKRRWIILFLFSACNFWNSYHWIHYSIISDIVVKYYEVPPWAVDSLSVVYMVSYVIFVLPALHVLNRKGLRVTVLLGITGVTLGAWMKVLSASPNRFLVTFVGQTLSGIALTFLFGVPPRLAAVWFGPNEVSTACSIGVFGAQLGVALGFMLPPWVVTDQNEVKRTTDDLSKLYYVGSIAPTVFLLGIILFFPKQPPIPPSPARANICAIEGTMKYRKTLKGLLTNRNYVMLLVAYAILHGFSNAFSTLLNQIVLVRFPHRHTDAGQLGTATIVSGIISCILLGIWLDKTHRFKDTGIALYALSFAGMLGFTFSTYYGSLPMTYACCTVIGLFLQAYMVLGYELAVELTYPTPEGSSGSILNAAVFIFSIPLIALTGWLLRTYGDLCTNLFFSALLGIGTVLNMFIKNERRRLEAQKEVTVWTTRL